MVEISGTAWSSDPLRLPHPGDLPEPTARVDTSTHVRAKVRSDLPAHQRETNETRATELTNLQIEYLSGQRLGRLATTGADGKPHVVPTSFRYNRELGTLDVGGHHVATTKKYRDVQANPWAAIVIDDLVSTNPWTPRMLEIRGRAEAIDTGGADLGPGFGEAFIRIYPERVNSFGIE